MSRQSQRISYAYGPDVQGVGQAAHFTKRWVAWIADAGVRLWQNGYLPNLPSNQLGARCDVFADEVCNHISLAFDQDGRPVIAAELELNGNIEIRKQAAGIEQRYTFTGRQPQLFNNWEVQYYPGDSDVVCLYLKEDGRKIYARFQREQFSVEYVLNELHTTMESLVETWAEGHVFHFLEGVNVHGKTITLKSRRYPPFPALAKDRGQAAADLLSGNHQQGIFYAQAGTDEGEGTTDCAEGAYLLRVIQATGDDSGEGTTDFAEGAYEQQIVTADAGADAGEGETDFADGEHLETVVPADAGTDAAATATAVDGGLYSKAVIDGSSRLDTAQQATELAEGSHLIP